MAIKAKRGKVRSNQRRRSSEVKSVKQRRADRAKAAEKRSQDKKDLVAKTKAKRPNKWSAWNSPKYKVKREADPNARGLTITNLLNVTKPFKAIVRRSRIVRRYRQVKPRISTNTKGQMAAEMIMKTDPNFENLSPKPKTLIITSLHRSAPRFSDKGVRVKVQCTCEFFLFSCEYALYKQGAADIHFSNGKRPNIRNPHRIPFVCKHLYRALLILKEKKL